MRRKARKIFLAPDRQKAFTFIGNMAHATVFDLRDLAPNRSREKIFALLPTMELGESLHVDVEQDPLPPWAQLDLERRYPSQFVWTVSDIKPNWAVDITRVQADAAPRPKSA